LVQEDIEVRQSPDPMTAQSVAVEFPDLPTGREFKEHVHGFLSHLRDSRLQELEQQLDGYNASLQEYRSLCTVREHGLCGLLDLHDEYLEALQSREFQRRYCLERARWEPGLTLEKQALQQLEHQSAINPHDVELLRQTIAAVYHRDETQVPLDTSFDKLQLRRREEKVLQLLERTQEAPAGVTAIAALKRAEALLSENAASGAWLASVAAAGQPLPDLAHMQAQLIRTEQRIEQLRASREKRALHLRRHEQHIESVYAAIAAKLLEVSSRLSELQDERLEKLIRRDKEGLLARLLVSTRHVATLLARSGFSAAHGPRAGLS
jgi:hypothetical protein